MPRHFRPNLIVRIDFGTVKADFRPYGRRRVLVEEIYDGRGIVYVNGVVKLADGTQLRAVLCIDECSSGEHCGTAVWTPAGGFAWQDDPGGLPKALGKSKDEVFPYRYKYSARLQCHDHHVGDDGWSHDYSRKPAQLALVE